MHLLNTINKGKEGGGVKVFFDMSSWRTNGGTHLGTDIAAKACKPREDIIWIIM